MNKVIRYLTIAATVLAFAFSYSLLELVGWKSLEGASTITKIHPSTYLFTLAALLGLVAKSGRYRQAFRSPVNLYFLFAALVLIARAVVITMGGTTKGELSTALVTWLTPSMLIVCYQSFDRSDLFKIGIGIRAFFLLNSLTGLAEALLHVHFIPDLNMFAEFEKRSSGLSGHPLSGAMLTGLAIVYLVSTRNRDRWNWMRLPELGIHAIAMFAFGGRAALVFTPIVGAISLLLNYGRHGDTKPTILQRTLPIVLVLVAIAVIIVPIPFVDTTLERFTNDGGSAETRNAAFQMLGTLDHRQWLVGVDADRRELLQAFFGSPAGIEISWIAMILTFGLIATAPMMVALPLLLIWHSRGRDRSAWYLVLFFLLVTTASLAFGTKTLIVSQLLMMMLTLSQGSQRLLLNWNRPRLDGNPAGLSAQG